MDKKYPNIMKEDNDTPHINNLKLPDEVVLRINQVIHPDEKVLNVVQTDMSVKGMYEENLIIVTDSRVISTDSTFTNGVCAIPVQKIKFSRIERMYSNSILMIGLNDRTVEFGRVSNACLDDLEEINEYINAVVSKTKGGSNSKLINDEINGLNKDKYYCPKCGQLLKNKNSVCIRCIDKRKSIARLMGYVKPFMPLVVLVLFVSIISTLIPLIPPYLTKLLIDDILPNKNLNGLYTVIGLFLVLRVSNVFISGIRIYNMRKLSQKIIFKIRTEVFAKVQALTISYFDKRSTGDVMSRVSNDTQRLQSFIIFVIQNTLTQIITFISVIIVMFSMDYQLALITIIPLPFIIWGTKVYSKKIKPIYKKIWRSTAELNSILTDSIPAIKVVKAFNAEERIINKFESQGEKIIDQNLTAAKKAAVYTPTITFSVLLGNLIIWLVGGYWVITQPERMLVGTLIAFINYASRLNGSINFFTNFNDQFQRAITSAERVFEILDTESEPNNNSGKIIKNMKGRIEFKNVSFYYEKGNTILKNLNFTIEPGETIGIVGSTGSGKSTIANLLLRYYDCSEGEILIDGINIKDIDINFLRNNIGYILQEPILFRDTIAKNIAFSKPNASIKDIINASKLANAHDFIIKFPDAYDTVLGERGIGLSGGEKQRISIARAILKNPNLLIMDEATSAVDSETEKLIQNSINLLIKNRTTLIIAHRLSTLDKADRIMVIENGEIVEFDTVENLMNMKGRFYHLVKMQSGVDTDTISYG